MEVTLLFFDGCPSWRTADRRLRELADEFGFDLAYRKVETPEAAEELSFRGSPTVLVDGRDPFARGDEPVGLSCRIYQTPDGPAGSPTTDQLREVLVPADQTGRSMLIIVVAAAVCCGAAALLVGAGLLAAGGGLLGSTELTVAAVVVAAAALWRLAVAIRRLRS